MHSQYRVQVTMVSTKATQPNRPEFFLNVGSRFHVSLRILSPEILVIMKMNCAAPVICCLCGFFRFDQSSGGNEFVVVPRVGRVLTPSATFGAQIANRDIIKSLQGEFSGDIEDAMCSIVDIARDTPAYFAKRLYRSMKGIGTDDSALIRVVVSRSEVSRWKVGVAQVLVQQIFALWLCVGCTCVRRYLLALYRKLLLLFPAGPSPGFRSNGDKKHKWGHIFYVQSWMYAATGRPNMKWGAGTTAPPLATPLISCACRLLLVQMQCSLTKKVNALWMCRIVAAAIRSDSWSVIFFTAAR